MLPFSSIDLSTALRVAGAVCQIGTALIAAGIGVMTFRYTKRQSTLALVNENNTLANLVNSTVIASEQARRTMAGLHEVIVGCPDDAVLFMYLNYVHNTYRMRQAGAISAQVWRDTLASCSEMIGRLRRDQVLRLLGRGYEAAFQRAVLARYDEVSARRPGGGSVATIRPWEFERRVTLVEAI